MIGTMTTAQISDKWAVNEGKVGPKARRVADCGTRILHRSRPDMQPEHESTYFMTANTSGTTQDPTRGRRVRDNPELPSRRSPPGRSTGSVLPASNSGLSPSRSKERHPAL